MQFVLTLVLAVFVTVPGIYLIARAKVATSLSELVAAGYFFGFGLFSLFYLGFSRYFRPDCADILIILLGMISLALLMRELKRQKLPLWFGTPRWHVGLIGISAIFILLITLASMAGIIDDDLLLHFPNVKRILMGDVPPHHYFFPDIVLRGHVARDLYVGYIAKGLNLRPELAIIYTTVWASPFYILAFYALAWRLGEKHHLATCLCFIGLLFLVSFDIGGYAIRAGSITYVTNNNLFAYAHAVVIGWVIERTACIFVDSGYTVSSMLRRNTPLLIVCALALASLYFVYLSNFLMFSVFLVALPILSIFTTRLTRFKVFAQSAALILLIVASSVATHVVVSPLLLERLQVTLNLRQVREPMAALQQARFQFPKNNLFSITDPAGIDRPVFRRKFLLAQGFSFFLGLAGLILGMLSANSRMFATSLFGWIILLWLMTVDMGEFRAETLRLLLLAHIAFGGSCGLVLGHCASFLQRVIRDSTVSQTSKRVLISAVGCSAVLLTLWMAQGSWQKLVDMRGLDFPHEVARFEAIHSKDPERWHPLLNEPKIDSEVIKLLATYTKSHTDRVLLKTKQSEEFRGDGHPIIALALMINTATEAGVGVIGVSHQHNDEVTMARGFFTCDYRSALFWQRPTPELLTQLAPNYIVIDPSLISSRILNSVETLPGVSKLLELQDKKGGRRILLSVKPEPIERKRTLKSIKVDSVEIRAKQNDVVDVSVEVFPSDSDPQIGLLVSSPKGVLVNQTDVPIVGQTKEAEGRYKLSFCMIQPGTWKVHFVDPSSLRPLHNQAILVHVYDDSKN